MRGTPRLVALVSLLLASCGGERVLDEAARACSHRGEIVRVGDVEARTCEGSTFVAASETLRAALGRGSTDAVVEALRREGARTLLVETDPSRRGDSVGARLARAERVDGFRTLVIERGATLVERFEGPSLTARESSALARVTRIVLAGATPPALDQFPASLRSPAPVEVMILLRDVGGPIFWRSSRGGSIASALLIALGVARTRWTEHSSRVQGSLPDRLRTLDVEVWLLREDGTYASRDPALIDTTLRDGFGVGYEMNDQWQYYLSERLGSRRGVEAFEVLFADQRLPRGALERRDLRLYRLVADRLSVSSPERVQVGAPPAPGLIQADGAPL